MKVLKILLLLIIIALFGAPYGVGMWAESEYNRMIAQLNNLYKADFKFVGNFSKGYLQSTANTEVTHLASNQNIKFTHTINQGPVIVNFNGWLNPKSYIPQSFGLAGINTRIVGDINDMIASIYDHKEAYTINTLINFNGAGVTKIKNFPLSKMVDGDVKVDWQGFDLTMNNTLHFTEFNGQLVMPLFAFTETTADQEGTKTVKIENIRMNFVKDTVNLADSIDFTLEKASATDDEATVFSLSQLVFNGKDKINGDLIEGNVKYNFNKLILVQDEYGPFIFDLSFKNFNYTVLREFAAINQAMAVATMQPAEVGLTEQQQLAFFASRPTVDMTIDFKTPKGDVDLKSHIEVGDKELKQVDGMSIFTTVKANFKFKIASEIVYALLARIGEEQIRENERMFFMMNKDPKLKNPYTLNADQMQSVVEVWINNLLNALRAKKYIVEENNTIASEIDINAKVLTVNGVESTPEDLNALQPLLIIVVPDATNPMILPPPGSNNSDAVNTPTPPLPADSSVPGGTDMNNTTVPSAEPTTMPMSTTPHSGDQSMQAGSSPDVGASTTTTTVPDDMSNNIGGDTDDPTSSKPSDRDIPAGSGIFSPQTQ